MILLVAGNCYLRWVFKYMKFSCIKSTSWIHFRSNVIPESCFEILASVQELFMSASYSTLNWSYVWAINTQCVIMAPCSIDCLLEPEDLLEAAHKVRTRAVVFRKPALESVHSKMACFNCASQQKYWFYCCPKTCLKSFNCLYDVYEREAV